MSQFMVLLYDNASALDEWAHMSPEQQQQGIQPYIEWSDRRAAQGRLVGGEKLADGTGRVLRGGAGQPSVTDGPFSETKEVVGGYLVLDVADYETAVETLRDHPHLLHGGTVEIREIEPLPVAQPDG
jgi:hypothetical protein